MSSPTLLIGIDAGGTKTRLLARLAGRSDSHEIVLDGVNLQRDGKAATLRMLNYAIGQAMAPFADPARSLDLSICAGVAGAGREAERRALSSRLEGEIRASIYPVGRCSVHLVTDAEIAFRAAHGDRPGLLIIVGTGSILWARTPDGRFFRAGGWGALLGDEGGGYKLGLAGLKAVADMIDGGPNTELMNRCCASFSLCTQDELLSFVYRQQRPLQELAPLVLDTAESGDAVASRIVRDQALALADRFQWLIDVVPPFPLDIVLMGGLSRHPFYRRQVMAALQDRKPASTFHEPRCEPAEAALEWAEREQC